MIVNYVTKPTHPCEIDSRLLEEAFRRAREAPLNRRADSITLRKAIIEEARRGTRHMHGLVSAASKVS
jgi:hypothetical protein